MEQARNGAKFLDQVYPEWYNVVDLETLDMRSVRFCVWGQCWKKDGWGFICRGARTIFSEEWLIEHGFLTFVGDPDITPFWKEEVLLRRV